MPWGTSVMNYAKNALGAMSWGGAAAGTRMMATGPAGRLGMSAAAGAIYGGTIGRDPGQSRLGGALTGAMGGAAMYGAARYGRAAFRGGRLANTNLLGGAGRAAGVAERGGMMGMARGAGQGAYGQMRRDARRAMATFGRKMTRPVNPVSSTLARPAPVNLPPLARPAPVKMSPSPVSMGPMAMERTNQDLLSRVASTRSALGMEGGYRMNMSPQAVAARRAARGY